MILGETSTGLCCYWKETLKKWILLQDSEEEGVTIGSPVPENSQISFLTDNDNIIDILKSETFGFHLKKAFLEAFEKRFDTEYWRQFYGEGEGISVGFLERKKK